VAIATSWTSKATRPLSSDGSTSARVTGNTRKPLLAIDARKPHETLRAHRARVAIKPVVTGMTTHAARTGQARRAADSDLLFNVLVKLVYAGNVAVETVNFMCELVEFFNNFFVVVLGRLRQSHKTRFRFHGPSHKNSCDDKSRNRGGRKCKACFV